MVISLRSSQIPCKFPSETIPCDCPHYGMTFARGTKKNSNYETTCIRQGSSAGKQGRNASGTAFRRSVADSGNHPHPNHAGRHFRRRPHRPRIRKRNPLPAADRTGCRGGQPFDRQHGEPGLSPGRATPPGFTGHGPAGRRRTQQKKTHRKSGVFQFPADGQVSEIAPRVPPKAGAAVIGTSELFQ